MEGDTKVEASEIETKHDGEDENATCCSKCHSNFQDVKMLPCSHTFCWSCLRNADNLNEKESNLTAKSMEGNQSTCDEESRISEIACPLCDSVEKTDDAKDMPRSNLIRQNEKSSELECTFDKVKTNSLPTATGSRCGLCAEEEIAPAVYTCVECNESLCHSCGTTHRRQTKTRNHRLLVASNDNRNRFLKTLCETDIDDYEMFGVVQLQKILGEAKICLQTLTQFLTTIPESRDMLHKSIKETENEICEFIYDFSQALEKHKENLLNQLQQLKRAKEKRLEIQEKNLCRLQTDLEMSCKTVDDMISNGTTEDLTAVQETVVEKLNKLLDFSKKGCDRLDTTVHFSQQSYGDIIGNFQMFGKVIGSVVCPGKCRITRSDLDVVRMGRQTTLMLETFDSEGRPFKHHTNVQAWITSVNHSRQAVSIKDKKNGRYQLSFVLKFNGPHQLHLVVEETPIAMSPFKFVVKYTRMEHCNTWHSGFPLSLYRPDTPEHSYRDRRSQEDSHMTNFGSAWSCSSKTSRHADSYLSNSTSSHSLIREVTL